MKIDFIRPNPPRLSRMRTALEAIEASGIYTNFGPVNTRLEEKLTDALFHGIGSCVTVANATIGLMIAIKDAARTTDGRQYALMPSFTFAATPLAAQWAGLTPLLCDIDPDTWLPDFASEQSLIEQYPGQIACIVPYATFGNCLDLPRYAALAERIGAGLVVDAAASLGSVDEDGRSFGTGFNHAVVFSMHATKTFATLEGGVMYAADPEQASRLRTMSNFGFGADRVTTMAGLNGKMTEANALVALARIDGFDEIVERRAALIDVYRQNLPRMRFQSSVGQRISRQFAPALLPVEMRARRADVEFRLAENGIGARHYFSPHVAEQPYFRDTCVAGDLRVTDEVAACMLSLPLSDSMTVDEVRYVCDCLNRAIDQHMVART